MKTLIKFIITALIIVCNYSVLFAGTATEKALRNEHSDLIKQIKKRYNCKQVTPQVADDGTLWFDIDDGVYHSISDASGNIILPLGKYLTVNYLSSYSSGKSQVPNMKFASDNSTYQDGGFIIYHPETKAAIIATTPGEILFFTPQGSLTNTLKMTNGFRIYPGYVMVNCNLGINENPKGSSLNNCIQGVALNKNGYWINNNGDVLIDSFDHMNLSQDQYINYAKTIDGVSRQGVLMLENPDKSIPCEFINVYRTGDKWMVVRDVNNSPEEFNPSVKYGINYRDEGERLLNKGDWDGVIDYYKHEGIKQPWALYFSGSALYKKAYNDGYMPKYGFIDAVNTGDFQSAGRYFNSGSVNEISPASMIEMLSLAQEMFKTYCTTEGSEEFKKDAENSINVIDIEYQSFAKQSLELPGAIEKYKQHNAKIKEEIAAKMEAERQRQSMIYGEMFNIFINSLQNITAAVSSKSNNQVNRSPSKASSVSKSTGYASESQDNSGRKGFLRGQVIEWKNKLKKAEASRAQALDNYNNSGSIEAKRALESKENTVNECLEMIRQFESELNSLK